MSQQGDSLLDSVNALSDLARGDRVENIWSAVKVKRESLPGDDAEEFLTKASVRGLIGIGEDLTASSSHTTGHAGHVSGGSAD